MAFDFDAWAIKWLEKIKILNLNNKLKKKWDYARHIAVHALWAICWGLAWSIIIDRYGPWYYLSAIPYLAFFVFYQEAFASDQHWKRIKMGRAAYNRQNPGMYEEQHNDLVSDVVTKAIPLVPGYGLIPIIKLFERIF
jgi:hypothetical protein|tara:strand:- start:412 stop:825 length:414 start_codon:yes stop_codon:yes gene_type:complete